MEIAEVAFHAWPVRHYEIERVDVRIASPLVHGIDAEQVQGTAPITIGIMQFAPKADMSAQIIRQLNRAPGDSDPGPSLRNIAEWYNSEYSRYTGDKDRREQRCHNANE